ncbi:MFS transporter, DHA1 family, inner membrane transport protein [Nonomuraea jiangxiensis]|uniref:MFS transporter, DHA1 family, inner membrane transport protein n=1 Tax=Nonomuraea jiangxiensis TaxID=633440 RepID=A0A1G8JA97_9ACTN|nr:MFS transporter, DHA1 family, inner membrane transport protein [Nonomuraea jiangxiensis]
MTLAALCVSVFVVGTSEYLISGLLPQVGADLKVSVGMAGQAVTVYALGVVVGGPLVAALTAGMPRKGLALGLMLVFAAGSAISALAPSYELLLVGRLVSSFSHAAFLALALVMATSVVPTDKTGTAIATVASGFTVATLLGVPLGALLGESAGWRAPFAVLTALALAGVALLAVVLPEQPAPATRLQDEVRVVTRRPVLLAIATTAVGFSGVAMVFTYIAPLLTRVSGFSSTAVSGLLLTYGAGGFLGNLLAGRLADKSMSATVRGVFGGLTGVLLLIPFAVVWQPSAVAAVLVLGLLATATIAPLQGLILRHAGDAPTLAVSANVGAFNLGAATGSAIGGVIVSAGALRWTGLAGAVLSLAGLALTYLVLPRTSSATRPADDDVPAAG